MLRRLPQRLLLLLTVFTAVLGVFLPAQAHAAILPTCDNRDLITIIPRPDLPRDTSCDGDEQGEVKVGALCDPRGASAIAPQHVLPVNDARIESPPRCASLDLSMQKIGPAPKDYHSMGPSTALVDPAMLGLEALVPPASYELIPAFAPPQGRGPAGEVRDVYHPPR